MSSLNCFKRIYDWLTIERIDNASSIRSAGQELYRYYEGNKSLLFGFEMRDGGKRAIIFRSKATWEAPFDDELVTPSHLCKIAQKLKLYFEKRGFEIELDAPTIYPKGRMAIHRSFMLTPLDEKAATNGLRLDLPLVQQLIVLGMAGLILDGGVLLQKICYAVVAYWVGVAVIMIRRRNHLTPVDRLVIRIGFLMACAISVVLTQIIWQWRDV